MRFLSNLASWATSFVKSHWKWLVSLGASALVFWAVAALMPVTAPVLLTMAVAGFASGLTSAIVSDLLDRHAPTLKHVLLSAIISAVLSAGSFGLAKWIGPHLPKLWKPVTTWLLQPAISVAGRPAVTAVTNAVATVAQPLIDSAIKAAELSAGQAGTEIARSIRDKPSTETAPEPARGPPEQTRHAPPRPSRTTGLVGALGGAQ